MMDISLYKQVILSYSASCFHIRCNGAQRFFFVGSHLVRAQICIAYENTILTRRHHGHFGFGRGFYVRPNPKHYQQQHHLHSDQ